MSFDIDIFKYIKPNKIGNFELIDKTITEKDITFMSPFYVGQRIALLKQGDEVVMSNTLMEKRTNFEFVKNAHGDVLVAGLGIGMIILETQNKEEVDSITIVEKNEEVIQLMANLPLNEKVTIIHGDIFDWKPPKMEFDVIYFDIWNYVNSDVYQEMKRLKSKYRRYLKSKKEYPERWMGCWAEYYAKNNLRLM